MRPSAIAWENSFLSRLVLLGSLEVHQWFSSSQCLKSGAKKKHNGCSSEILETGWRHGNAANCTSLIFWCSTTTHSRYFQDGALGCHLLAKEGGSTARAFQDKTAPSVVRVELAVSEHTRSGQRICEIVLKDTPSYQAKNIERLRSCSYLEQNWLVSGKLDMSRREVIRTKPKRKHLFLTGDLR